MVIPSRQCWHSLCVRFFAPQPEHSQRLVTSFRAFPAICLCLFLECDTLFFGTARRTDSQMSSNVGRLRLTPGRVAERKGSHCGVKACRYSVAHREDVKRVGVGSRGSSELVMAAIATDAGKHGCLTARYSRS